MIPSDKAAGAAPDSQISIDIGFNQMIQRVDTNVTQEVIVTTADKAKLCLRDALERMERRTAWIAPTGIMVTLAVVFPTTTFQDFIGVSKDTWKAFFLFALLACLLWLMFCLFKIRRSLSVDQIVEMLRTSASQSRGPSPVSIPSGPLVIHSALYGYKEKTIDITPILNRAAANNKLRVLVCNELCAELGGDPCPNIGKYLTVRFAHGGQFVEKTVSEGTILELP